MVIKIFIPLTLSVNYLLAVSGHSVQRLVVSCYSTVSRDVLAGLMNAVVASKHNTPHKTWMQFWEGLQKFSPNTESAAPVSVLCWECCLCTCRCCFYSEQQ